MCINPLPPIDIIAVNSPLSNSITCLLIFGSFFSKTGGLTSTSLEEYTFIVLSN